MADSTSPASTVSVVSVSVSPFTWSVSEASVASTVALSTSRFSSSGCAASWASTVADSTSPVSSVSVTTVTLSLSGPSLDSVSLDSTSAFSIAGWSFSWLSTSADSTSAASALSVESVSVLSVSLESQVVVVSPAWLKFLAWLPFPLPGSQLLPTPLSWSFLDGSLPLGLSCSVVADWVVFAPPFPALPLVVLAAKAAVEKTSTAPIASAKGAGSL